MEMTTILFTSYVQHLIELRMAGLSTKYIGFKKRESEAQVRFKICLVVKLLHT